MARPEVTQQETRYAQSGDVNIAFQVVGDGPFDLVWSFVGGEPKVNRRKTLSEIPAETEESKAMSKELKRRGFRFVGPTVCYAFMQACGLVDDHTTDCFRFCPSQGRSQRRA